MARVIGWFSLGGLFLAISPKMRDTMMTSFVKANSELETYSPYSYIGLIVAVLFMVMVVFHRSSAPR
jgi:hypothetical protein